jgi:DNA-binding HxlR family transcriptional regulator
VTFNTRLARSSTAGVETQPRISEQTSAALDLFTQRWVPHLLYLLCQGEARFSDLAYALPELSRRVLTDRLRALADDGLIHRTVIDGPPTRIIYRLTSLGEQLRDTFAHIDAWAADYRPPPLEH